MKTRAAFILLGILVLFGLVAVLADRAEQRRYSGASAGKLLPGLDPAKAVRLEVKTKDGTSLLEKKEGSWKVAPEGFAADETAVKDGLEKLARIEKTTIASENPAKHEALEVKEGDGKAAAVQVWAEGATEPVAKVLIGKTGADFQSNFVRVAGEDRVYQTKEQVRPAIDRGARGWRDRSVVKVAADDVTRIELTSSNNGHFLLERADAKTPWGMVEPYPAPAKASAVESILRTFEDLQADGFAAAATAADPAATGLDNPEARSQLTLKDGRKVELLWGKESSAGKLYAKKADGDTVYEMASYRKNAVFPAMDALKETEAATPAASPAAAASASPSASPAPK